MRVCWLSAAGLCAGFLFRGFAAGGVESRGLLGFWRLTNAPAGISWMASATNVPGAIPVCRLVPPGGAGSGLVPLFEVPRQRVGMLRRVPPKGQEQQFDPVGWVLPRADEKDAGEVSGRWRVVSRKADGAVHRLSWDLAAAGNVVSGRFDPDTDYRFAFIVDGAVADGRLSFRVEYIEDRYEVRGQATAGGWAGTWQRPDGSEKGQWSATRALPDKPATLAPDPVLLWEWRKAEGPEVWYGVEGKAPEGEGWTRTEPALGLVWRPSESEHPHPPP